MGYRSSGGFRCRGAVLPESTAAPEGSSGVIPVPGAQQQWGHSVAVPLRLVSARGLTSWDMTLSVTHRF
jgi:hypothetical protein